MAISKQDIADALGRPVEDLDLAFGQLDVGKRQALKAELAGKVSAAFAAVNARVDAFAPEDLAAPAPSADELVKAFQTVVG